MKNTSISGLYYNYGRISDIDIKKVLNNIKIVVLSDKDKHHYCLNVEKILNNPRGISFTFDIKLSNKPIDDLIVYYKTIKYLVKSTSRFYLKPDIGEILDQISFADMGKIKYIEIFPYQQKYKMLPNTQGEHFILTAKLYI